MKKLARKIARIFSGRKLFIFLLPFCIFFIPAIYTISDYSINWDEPEHFMRGQGYLHYFLTGEKDYKKLPRFQEFQNYLTDKTKKPKIKLPRYSIYQNSKLDGEYYLTNSTGHPPLNDIMASLSNYVFYQKLGWLSDIDSYHLFIILSSSLLAFLIFFWTKKEYGFFPALIAVFSLLFYPLFFEESHQNIKDPVESLFFTLTIYTFFRGITEEKRGWLIFSSLAFGIALGTKFNVLFTPLIFIPWIIIHYGKRFFKLFKFWFIFLIYPFIAFFIFFSSYPYLWQNSLKRIPEVFNYYKGIGMSGNYIQPASFYIFGFNTYPWQTILFTTPLVILFFTFFGIAYVLRFGFKEKNKTSILILLWFILPIARVSVPGSSLYGGVRQIMEFIPAMAILSGIGAKYIVTLLNCYIAKIKKQFGNRTIKQLNDKKIKLVLYSLVLLSFLPITLKLISIHPNEGVYFNPLIGGLKGAREKDFPSWGSNLGGSYRQGVNWINNNAEYNAKVALVISTEQNIPRILFRDDINFNNSFWSNTNRKGEYLIEAIYDDWIREWHYDGEYVDKVLKPVYEVKVDNVAILKVWKNDPNHTDPRFLKEKLLDSQELTWDRKESMVIISMNKVVDLIRVKINYNSNNCFPFESGEVSTSLNKEDWILEREPMRVSMSRDNKFSYPFVARRAKYIQITPISKSKCNYDMKSIQINYI